MLKRKSTHLAVLTATWVDFLFRQPCKATSIRFYKPTSPYPKQYYRCFNKFAILFNICKTSFNRNKDILPHACVFLQKILLFMKRQNRYFPLVCIMMFWFTISFITNILRPLIPEIIDNFQLKDLAMAGFIPTSFSSPTLSCPYQPDCL